MTERFLGATAGSAPAAVKAEADRVVQGAKTPAEKAARLYAFVAHDIRTIDLPLGWAGYEPHSADVVLQNRYADDRDKVGLLLALAGAEGLSGRPVLVRTGKVNVLDSVPTVAQFDRMIAQLNVGGKDVWVDPSDEHGQYGVALAGQDNLALALVKGATGPINGPPGDPAISVSHVAATYALTPDGKLDAQYTYDLTGWFAQQASTALRPLKGEKLDLFFQTTAAEVSPAAFDKGHQAGNTLSVTGPLKITQHVEAPGYSVAQGHFCAFELPGLTLAVAGVGVPSGLSARKYPLWVGAPRTQERDVTVKIPAGWKVAYAPAQLSGSADGVSFSSSCAVSGRTITCHRQVKLDQALLSPEKYPDFHQTLTKLDAYEQRVILLTKG